MVIKVSDPDVKVKVDGEDVVITGAGPQELRVKPGMHTVETAKGGKIKTEVVTVERGGKKTVEVGFEPGSEVRTNRDPASPRVDRLRVESAGLAIAKLNREREILARQISAERTSAGRLDEGDSRASGYEASIKEHEAWLREVETQLASLHAEGAAPAVMPDAATLATLHGEYDRLGSELASLRDQIQHAKGRGGKPSDRAAPKRRPDGLRSR